MKNKFHRHNIKVVMTIMSVFLVICFVAVLISGDQYKKYLGLTEYPNCMKLSEFSDEGNNEGIRFQTVTLTPDYQDVYSLAFESYYMVSSDKAFQKYQLLYEGFIPEDIVGIDEQVISPTVRVRTIIHKNDNIYFLVQDNTTVYKAYGVNNEMDKKQKWFHVLKINYHIPQII